MSTQPEALHLADALEELDQSFSVSGMCGEAAAELRRLHEINQELLTALEFCAGTSYITDAREVAQAAIAKAEGEAK